MIDRLIEYQGFCKNLQQRRQVLSLIALVYFLCCGVRASTTTAQIVIRLARLNNIQQRSFCHIASEAGPRLDRHFLWYANSPDRTSRLASAAGRA